MSKDSLPRDIMSQDNWETLREVWKVLKMYDLTYKLEGDAGKKINFEPKNFRWVDDRWWKLYEQWLE